MSRKRPNKFLLAAGGIMAGIVLNQGALARAETLFETGLANSSGGVLSSTLNNPGSTPGYRAANDFILSTTGPALIERILWTGVSSHTGGFNFTFTFYQDNGGMPGAVLQTMTGTLSTSGELYQSDLANGFVAPPGVPLWLSIYNAAPDAMWGWASKSPGTCRSTLDPPGNSWVFLNSAEPQFRLEGVVVPEPCSYSMLILTVVTVALITKRLNRKLPAADALNYKNTAGET